MNWFLFLVIKESEISIIDQVHGDHKMKLNMIDDIFFD